MFTCDFSPLFVVVVVVVLVGYSEEDIRKWREERRKRWPSNANVEKKLVESVVLPEHGFVTFSCYS